jgi:hypothetical protein
MRGQGPLLDALTANRPVLVSDLSDPGSLSRWPMFAPEATDRGIGAVFAFPVTAAPKLPRTRITQTKPD